MPMPEDAPPPIAADDSAFRAQDLRALLRQRGAAETLVAAFAFLCYLCTLSFRFVYDDITQIEGNPALSTWGRVGEYFTRHVWYGVYPHLQCNYYRPVFLLWLRGCEALFGLSPTGWHAASAVCHAAATLLLLLFVERLSGDRRAAIVAALLFAAHPAHIESVAWVSGVADPMLAVELLASSLLMLAWARKGGWRRLAGAAFLWLLMMLTKETGVVAAPLALLTLVVADRPQRLRRSALAVGAMAIVTVLYLALRVHALGMLAQTGDNEGWPTLLLTTPSILWIYARQLLLPTEVHGFYGVAFLREPNASFWLPLAGVLICLSVAAWLAWRARPRVVGVFAIGALILPILPTLNMNGFSSGDAAHLRYLYLPTIGFTMLASVAWRAAELRWPSARRAMSGALAVVVLTLSALTLWQQFPWATNAALFADAYRYAPQDPQAANNYASVLLERRNYEAAEPILLRVSRQAPNLLQVDYNLGRVYYFTRRLPQAEASLRRAVFVRPDDADALYLLGMVFYQQKRLQESLSATSAAVALKPSLPGAHLAIAVVLHDMGAYAASLAEAQRELELHPNELFVNEQLRRWSEEQQQGSAQ